MKSRPALALLVVVTALAVGACPPKPAEAPLPPAGLAGGAPGSAPNLALPGAGAQVPDPSGAPAGQLPAGHPPIGGAGPTASAAGAPHGAPAPGGPGAAPPSALPPALTGAPAAPPPPQETLIAGQVVETMSVPDYTYMRVKTTGGEEWVAVSRTTIAVGDQVSVASNVVMDNFPSRALNRTFPRLTMGTLVGAPRKQ